MVRFCVMPAQSRFSHRRICSPAPAAGIESGILQLQITNPKVEPVEQFLLQMYVKSKNKIFEKRTVATEFQAVVYVRARTPSASPGLRR